MMKDYFSIWELPIGWLIFIGCLIVLFFVIVGMLIQASRNTSKMEPPAGTIINNVDIDWENLERKAYREPQPTSAEERKVKKGIPELDEIYPDEHSPEHLNIDEINKRLAARRKAMLS